MKVAEIYESIQGEGFLTGTKSVFLRASGCNLRCKFCDTPFTSWKPEGDDLSVDDIISQVTSFSVEHIVITGGEPMLFAELVPICERLHDSGHHITIETAGTLYLPVVCDLMSISPKMSNSTPDEADGKWRDRHEQTRHIPDVIRRLTQDFDYQLKFVIRDPEDCEEVKDYLLAFDKIVRKNVFMMPEGTEIEQLQNIEEWLLPFCDQHEFQYCPRKHIEWFGNFRGT